MALGRRNKQRDEVGASGDADDGPIQPSTSLPVGATGGDQTSTASDLPDAPEPASTWNEPESTDDPIATPPTADWEPVDVEPEAPEAALPVPTDNHPELVEDNDDLLPVRLESPLLPPHLQELKVQAQDALIERMGTRLYDRTLTEDQIESYVMTELGGWLFEEDARITDSEREQLTDELLNDVLRHGPIEPFLADEGVSEIMVNGLSNIYVERNGKLVRTQSQFLTEAHLRQVIERIVSKIGRRIDESSPMVDARLPDGSRVNAVIPPLAVDGPSLTIRKFSKDALGVDDLISFGTLSPTSVDFLSASVRGRLNVLVSGGTGTGKTTLLNVLSNFIPEAERIVTIEDAVELQLRQDHLVRLESRPANVEGKGQITIRDLVRNSLRMRPDRVIIGECRGGEALDMLQAMNTGHDGSLTTLHANTPRDAIARLETMVMMAGFDLPVKAIRQQISGAVDVLIQANRLQGGPRRVTAVTEVVGMEQDTIVLQDIYRYQQQGIGEDGKAHGHFECTGVRPSFMDRLESSGVRLPASAFRERVMMDA